MQHKVDKEKEHENIPNINASSFWRKEINFPINVCIDGAGRVKIQASH